MLSARPSNDSIFTRSCHDDEHYMFSRLSKKLNETNQELETLLPELVIRIFLLFNTIVEYSEKLHRLAPNAHLGSALGISGIIFLIDATCECTDCNCTKFIICQSVWKVLIKSILLRQN